MMSKNSSSNPNDNHSADSAAFNLGGISDELLSAILDGEISGDECSKFAFRSLRNHPKWELYELISSTLQNCSPCCSNRQERYVKFQQALAQLPQQTPKAARTRHSKKPRQPARLTHSLSLILAINLISWLLLRDRKK